MPMSPSTIQTLAQIGFILDFFGKILVSYTAISVHHRVWKEHKIDEKVFSEMAKERNFGILGIAFMFIGFSLEILGRVY